MAESNSCAITVINGFLGAGKTTILLHLLRELQRTRPDYKVAWVKNEFGVNQVDTLMAQQNQVEVKEIVNGCMCCTLVGQFGNGLVELAEKYRLDRIFVETSGSAYPAPLAWEINRVATEHPSLNLKLDAILCCIDCENFPGYEDTSFTARQQAKYTDLIVLTKHESVSKQRMDEVIDALVELNPDTPRVRAGPQGQLDLELVMALCADAKIGPVLLAQQIDGIQHDVSHHALDIEVLDLRVHGVLLTSEKLQKFLDSLDQEFFYRVKGVVWIDHDEPVIVNYAFKRYKIEAANLSNVQRSKRVSVLTFMGRDIHRRQRQLRKQLQLREEQLKVIH